MLPGFLYDSPLPAHYRKGERRQGICSRVNFCLSIDKTRIRGKRFTGKVIILKNIMGRTVRRRRTIARGAICCRRAVIGICLRQIAFVPNAGRSMIAPTGAVRGAGGQWPPLQGVVRGAGGQWPPLQGCGRAMAYAAEGSVAERKSTPGGVLFVAARRLRTSDAPRA